MNDLSLRKQTIPNASVSLNDVFSYMANKAEPTVANTADVFATSGATLSRGSNFADIFTNPAGTFVLLLTLVTVGVLTLIRITSVIKKIRKKKLEELQAMLAKETQKPREQVTRTDLIIRDIITQRISLLREKLYPVKTKAERRLQAKIEEKKLKNQRAAKLKLEQELIKEEAKRIADQKKYYAALNNDETIASDKNKMNVSAVGRFFMWFIPIFCVFGMILFSVDGGLTLQLFINFFTSPIGIGITAGSVAAGVGASIIHRFFNSKFRALIRKRKLNATQEFESNCEEFNRLMSDNSLKDDKDNLDGDIRQSWKTICEYKFYTHENKRLRSPAQIEMQREFLNHLHNLKALSGLKAKRAYYVRWISPLDTCFPKTRSNLNELNEEEAADLTDGLTLQELPKKDRHSVIRSAIGFGLMWILVALSLPGIDFTNIPALIALFATPPGWIILGCSFVVGLLASIFKYKSKERLKLKERRVRMQRYLLNFEECRINRSNIENEHFNRLWSEINAIDDIALRAQLQKKLLANEQVEDNLIALYKAKSAPIQAPVFSENKARYIAYQEGKLTRADKWSVFRSAVGAYCNTSIPIFCFAGLVLVNITLGIAGFAAIAALFTTPVGWGLLAVAIGVGLIFAARAVYIKRKAKLQEREDRAAEEMEFNELEFKRLGGTQPQYAEILTKWNYIKASKNFNNPTKVELQRDFLKCLSLDNKFGGSRTSDFYREFLTLEAEQRQKEKDKKRDIPTFSRNRLKYAAINSKQLTGQEFRQTLRTSASAFVAAFIIPGSLAAVMALIGVTASVSAIMGPIGWAFLGVAITAGIAYAAYKFYQERKLKIATREADAKTDIETNNATLEELLNSRDHKQQDILILNEKTALRQKWEMIIQNPHYNNAAKAEMQKDFLDGLKCVLANPERYYDSFIATAPGKTAQTHSTTSHMLAELTPAHDATQELDPCLPLLKLASPPPRRKTICEMIAEWKANSGKRAGSNPQGRIQVRGFWQRANQESSGSVPLVGASHTTAPQSGQGQ